MPDGTIVIQQNEYAEAVTSIPMSKERRKQKDHDTTDQEKGQMRAALGEVNWLVSGMRPDLAASCSLMQQRTAKSVVQDLIAVNRLVSMVRDFSGLEIRIKPIPMEDVEKAVWSDASFANAATDLGLRKARWAPISPWRWRSFKQDRQVASTLGAELLTLSRAIAEAKWVRSMWTKATSVSYTLESDKERTLKMPITVCIDSRPAYDHLNGQVMTIKDKRLAIEMLLVKQDRWLPTGQMLVDGLTKLGAPMELLRRVLKEGRMILVENDEVIQWIGKIARKKNPKNQ